MRTEQRRVAALWLTALVAAALVGGCGIPDSTDVIPRGAGPSTGVPSGGDTTLSRSQRQDTTDRAQFVANYLEAAAGDREGAVNRVKAFLSPGAATTFRPPELRVVRLTEKPLVNPGNPQVELRVEQVGVLGPDGVLEPSSSANDKTTYRLTIKEVNGASGLFVTEAPQVMLLSDSALNAYYQRRTIYFWNKDATALVPDLRYLPMTVANEQQPNEVINWLTGGPARWLLGAVDPLPEGTKPIGNVPAVSDDKLEINLTGPALPPDDPHALERLRDQLMWSLRPDLALQLQIKIDHQVQGTFSDNSYFDSNPAYRSSSVPERFCVYGGRIQRLANSANPTEPVPSVLSAVNHNVRMASLSRSDAVTYAALVADEAGKQVLRVGSGRAGDRAAFVSSRLPGPVGRPVWAFTAASAESGTAAGLVPAGGRLFSFTPDSTTPRLVDWPGRPAGITAVAVAPDAQRVAVVAGGRLYLAVLTSNGNGNGMQIAASRPIRTLMKELTAVDWSSEGTVVVAGVHRDTGRVAIMDVSIDGASQIDRLPDLGTARVTQLVAYPANPANGTGDANSVAYVADNLAYDALTSPVRIGAGDLAAPVPAAPAGTTPTAPFFLN